jgi:hypothetical protein
MLRETEATIRDPREKLATANQNFLTMPAELFAKRQAREKENDAEMVVPEPMVPMIREGGLPVVKRPVGRPRNIVAVQPIKTMTAPSEKPLAIVPQSVDVAGAIVGRPVGRPRKTAVAQPT